MPNCYARLADVKAEYQGSGAGSTLDSVLLRMSERASRLIDERTQRHFYHLAAQTILAPHRPRPAHVDGTQLWLPSDLASITSVKLDQDGDGVFEKTLTVETDYWPYYEDGGYTARADRPVIRLDVNPRSTQLSTWPSSVRGVQIIGADGYSDEVELLTTAAEAVDNAETGIDLAAAASPGDTLVIDDEQMDVLSALATAPFTVTVTRGVNGSTKATHDNGASVYRRRFPREIEMAASMQAVRFAREVQTGYGGSLANAELAGMSFRSMYPAIRDAVEPYVLRELR